MWAIKSAHEAGLSRLVKIFMRRDCRIGAGAKAFSTADATSPTGLKRSRGREEQNVVLTLVVGFLVIMLLELDERFPQRTFPEQDQMGEALLFNRSHPAFRKSVQIRAARGSRRHFTPPAAKVSRNSAQNLASRSCNT
jgi:hypothetical protein